METIKKYIKSNSSQLGMWWKRQSLRRKIFYGVLVALVVLFIVSRGGDDRIFEEVTVQNIQRTVVASGKVVSTTDLSLSFDSSGVVRSVSAKVGDVVKKGQVLATLDQRSQRAAVGAARGRVLSAEARYQKVLDGSSNEEIAIAQINLNSAKRDLENTKRTQENLVSGARRALYSSGLIANPANSFSSANTPTIGGSYNGTIEGVYVITVESGSSGYMSYSGIESGRAVLSDVTPQSLGTKGLTIIFPATNLTPGAVWEVSVPNKNGASYVANANAYTNALTTSENAISDAEDRVAAREAELALKRATARQPDVDAALAEVITAQAGLEEAQAALERTVLRAPADGTITAVDIKLGQVAQALTQAMILQDISNLYLEAEVGESNISLLSVGLPVSIEFDALGSSKVVYGTVSSIDPAATVNNNIVSYKIKALLEQNEQIRPGMTATMIITALSKNGALVLPGRVIQEDEDELFVEKLVQTGRKEELVRQLVTTGIRADGDLVEVFSGLTEGEKVLWNQDKK
jgi:HlyD family secretion protein